MNANYRWGIGILSRRGLAPVKARGPPVVWRLDAGQGARKRPMGDEMNCSFCKLQRGHNANCRYMGLAYEEPAFNSDGFLGLDLRDVYLKDTQELLQKWLDDQERKRKEREG